MLLPMGVGIGPDWAREGEWGRDELNLPASRLTSCPSAYEKHDSFGYFSFKEK